MELRPYQTEAVEAIEKEWGEVNKTLLVLPTGCGKTVVFCTVAYNAASKGGRVLILAHRDELIQQAKNKYKAITGEDCAIEKANQTCIGSPYNVVVGSVQTMQNLNRLNKFPKDFFQYIIVDEAHHCLSESYQKVLKYFNVKVLGVTATPDRGDKKKLGEYFDTVSYEYSLIDAIKDEYLSPIKVQRVPLEIDISKVHMQNGDYRADELGEVIQPLLKDIADAVCDKIRDRKTVVFLPLVSISQKFKFCLMNCGLNALEVNGESPDRKEILEAFDKAPKGTVLCNSMLLTEGWDCPSVDCVIVLRPTKSRPLYCQMIGRGTRLFPGKEDLLILDLMWLSEKHDLVKPVSIFESDKDIQLRMEAMISDDSSLDLIEATEKAESDAQRDIESERIQSMQNAIMKHFVQPVQANKPIPKSKDVARDLALLDELVSFREENTRFSMPATLRQEDTISKLMKIDSADFKLSKNQASDTIRWLLSRKNNGLSSFKQICFLRDKGFRNVQNWTMMEASEVITKLRENRWDPIRAGYDAESYTPNHDLGGGEIGWTGKYGAISVRF